MTPLFLAQYLWILFYEPPYQEEFTIMKTHYVEPVSSSALLTDIVGASESGSESSLNRPEHQPTTENYKQLRPDPTGCYLGDSIPMEACE